LSRKIIVIAPVKNEEWILPSFLAAVSEYADHIILGDHFSTDRSVEIAKAFDKVSVVNSTESDFSEATRRNQLLSCAREFGQENVILSIDADEHLDPRFISSGGLSELKNLPRGTRFAFPHFNIYPDTERYWISQIGFMGMVDDGSLHDVSDKIHFSRIPSVKGVGTYHHRFGGLIHLQYLDWERMQSKRRWYMAWEAANLEGASTLSIHRRYHHVNTISKRMLRTIPGEWSTFFNEKGVRKAVSDSSESGKYWWDSEIPQLISGLNPAAVLTLGLAGYTERSAMQGVDKVEFDSYHKVLRTYLKVTRIFAKSSDSVISRLALRALDKVFDSFFNRKKLDF
jgi:glycosyltransferase involved in cell wall biosynthesis